MAAAEEERFRRIKHWAGLPTRAAQWCLQAGGLSLADVDYIAVNQDAGANIWRKFAYLAARRPDLSLVRERIRNKAKRKGVEESLSHELGQSFHGKVRFVEHHLAHLASAFLVAPFERATAVSVDGFGDFASAAWGIGMGGSVEVEDKIYFPHSLGVFYQALTQYLGFPNYGDEYKVMGLAPYGEPRFLDEMRRIVHLEDDGSFRLDLTYFRHASEKVHYEWEGGEPTVGTLYTSALLELLGPDRGRGDEIAQRHRDIARSVQARYEEVFFHLLNSLHRRHGLDELVLAGGCAMNSVANGKVYRNTPFRRRLCPARCGRCGRGLGAAFAVWSEISEGGAALRNGPRLLGAVVFRC